MSRQRCEDRRRCGAVLLVAVVLVAIVGVGCSGGDFGDFASEGTSTIPQSSVTLTPGSSAPPEPTSTTPSTTTQGGATTTAAPPTTVGGTRLPPPTPPSQPVVTGARTGATATGLTANPGCEGSRSLVRLTWTPVGTAEQAVAVSARPDGLDSGNFTTSETLPASRAIYELRESQPGGVYYWRVLTRQGSGWAASETAQFEGPTCTTF